MKKFKYDVSIVVPVYNASEYLKECIDSIISQTLSFDRIEVILIDDGSTDDSLNICKNYCNKYTNIKLIRQKNSGVSTARNNGIKSSLGKYIMLLDSDDSISKNTVMNLFNFFEEHYDEIDIVTYPIKYNRYGRISKNIRYDQYDKGTDVYDVNEYIYLNQSTVNIMIKNELEKTNLYNVNMKLSEDQNFDTEMIMKKEKIGFVKDAVYYYRRHDASVSSTRNNPFYCFEDIMSYNENLLKKYKKNNKIPKYIQSLVINTIKWRLNTDDLFPYYLDDKEYKKAIDRIKKMISKIDVDVIINVPDMNFYHKIYLLKFCGHELEVKFEGSINLYCDNELICSEDYVNGLISKMRIRNNKLILAGDLLCPIFKTIKPDLYIEKKCTNGEIVKEKIDIIVSNESNYMARFQTTTAYRFDIEVDIENVRSFELYTMIDRERVNIDFKFKRFTSNFYIKNKKNIFYNENKFIFIVKNRDIINILKAKIKKFNYCLKHNSRAAIYRMGYYLYPTKRNIWLYTDRGNSLDNAYVQFKADFNRKDKYNRYYLHNLKEEEINKYFTNKEKKYLVKQNSIKHKMLYLKAKKIITSFADLQVYCPYNSSVSYYNDLTDYDLIYLQHGILHASLLRMYSKEFTEIDKFVISTNFEKENLINKYHYKENDFIESGMPRIKSELNAKTKNKILFAPSWRSYLIGNLVKNERKLKTNDFINSKFYKEIYEFLHSKKLHDYLIKNDLVLEFKLHPIFKEYAYLFKLKDVENVSINYDKTIVSDYKIFITDFSSFQFDFVRLKRPIIYFMPDMLEFKAGLHSYRELDLKYEDAFGNLCLTNDELIKEMIRISKNDYKVDKKYLSRMDKFFLDINNPTEIIYKELIK